MTDLYLITGFLGAGKTTFLNNLFTVFKNKKTAVIVNEFGKEGIDGNLLKKQGYQVTEINNGSIFCVCRSDKFMEVLTEAYKNNPEVLLVETSGLSDPTGIDVILTNLKKFSDVEFDYKGCICLVDAKNFVKVKDTAVVVASQLSEASLVIVNKVDLSDEEKISDIDKFIREINSKCYIFHTTYSKIPSELIKQLKQIKNSENFNKVDIISACITIDIPYKISYDAIENLIEELKCYVYRIKGFVSADTGYYFIDGVGDNVKINPVLKGKDSGSIVVLYNSKNPVSKIIRKFCTDFNCTIRE